MPSFIGLLKFRFSPPKNYWVNALKSRIDYISKFERPGIPVTENDLVLSMYATAQHVAKERPAAKEYMVGAPGLRKELELAGLELLEDP